MAKINEIESLAREEGMTAQTGDLYGIIANLFLEMGEIEMAREYAVVAVRNLRHYAGFDSERAQSAMEFLGRLEDGEGENGEGAEKGGHGRKGSNKGKVPRSAAWSDLSLFEVEK